MSFVTDILLVETGTIVSYGFCIVSKNISLPSYWERNSLTRTVFVIATASANHCQSKQKLPCQETGFQILPFRNLL